MSVLFPSQVLFTSQLEWMYLVVSTKHHSGWWLPVVPVHLDFQHSPVDGHTYDWWYLFFARKPRNPARPSSTPRTLFNFSFPVRKLRCHRRRPELHWKHRASHMPFHRHQIHPHFRRACLPSHTNRWFPRTIFCTFSCPAFKTARKNNTSATRLRQAQNIPFRVVCFWTRQVVLLLSQYLLCFFFF